MCSLLALCYTVLAPMANSTARREHENRLHADGRCIRCAQPKADPTLRLCAGCYHKLADATKARRAARRAERETKPERGHGVRLDYNQNPNIIPEYAKPSSPRGGSDIDSGIVWSKDDPNRGISMRRFTDVNFADWQQRQWYGPRPPIWRFFTGPPPVTTEPDFEAASRYLFRLQEAKRTECGLRTDPHTSPFSDREANSLRREIRKWRKRVNHEDWRYNMFGNSQRGLTRAETEQLNRVRSTTERRSRNVKEAAGGGIIPGLSQDTV